MRHPSSIRRQRAALQRRVTHGPRERAAVEAMIGALTWVLDSRHEFNPESYAIDAFVDDHNHEVTTSKE